MRDRLQKMGLTLAEDDLVAMFRRYDTSGNGVITFAELANAIFNKPAHGGKYWADQRAVEVPRSRD
jgi:Ca2+-binding EF-hand superfamily protein